MSERLSDSSQFVEDQNRRLVVPSHVMEHQGSAVPHHAHREGDFVVLANTLPGKIRQIGRGKYELVYSPGGLVTAMDPMMSRQHENGNKAVWGAVHAADAEPEGLAEALRTASHERGINFWTSRVSEKRYRAYYAGFANRVLWPALHGRGLEEKMEDGPDFYPAYVYVNTQLAMAAVDKTQPEDRIFVQDYHLLLVGREMRELGAHQRISYFHHIPFPPPDVFGKIPHHQELLEGMLAYDEIGLQTNAFKENFKDNLQAFVRDAQIQDGEHGDYIVIFKGKQTRIVANPISIDPYEFKRQADLAESREEAFRLANTHGGEFTLVDVSRFDYTKGIDKRIDALDLFYEKHPDMRGVLTMIQVVAQARTGIPAYDEYVDSVNRKVTAINEKYGKWGWLPVVQKGAMGRIDLTAHYQFANGAAVTPVSDGMNLVAKEYVATARPDGLLMLSKYAGVAEEFQDALLVDPFNTEAFADTFDQATRMSVQERTLMMDMLRSRLYMNTVYHWAERVNAGFERMPRSGVIYEARK